MMIAMFILVLVLVAIVFFLLNKVKKEQKKVTSMVCLAEKNANRVTALKKEMENAKVDADNSKSLLLSNLSMVTEKLEKEMEAHEVTSTKWDDMRGKLGCFLEKWMEKEGFHTEGEIVLNKTDWEEFVKIIAGND
jgi:cbb3-type cytochrome oxidase subunit 3